MKSRPNHNPVMAVMSSVLVPILSHRQTKKKGKSFLTYVQMNTTQKIKAARLHFEENNSFRKSSSSVMEVIRDFSNSGNTTCSKMLYWIGIRTK